MYATKCRIWWPMPLSIGLSQSDILLFGWCFDSGPNSVDMVVSSGIPAKDVDDVVFREAVQLANGKVPRSLQECSMLSLLGHCAVNLTMKNADSKDTSSDQTCAVIGSANGVPHDPEKREEVVVMTGDGGEKEHDGLLCEESHEMICNCEHYGLTVALKQERQALIQNGNWIQLHLNCPEFPHKRLKWIPKLNHLHWSGKLFCISHLHVYYTV